MALAFSPDGRLVAAWDANSPSPRVAIFDVRTGRQVKRLVAPGDARGSVLSLAFSPDGSRLLWGERVARSRYGTSRATGCSSARCSTRARLPMWRSRPMVARWPVRAGMSSACEGSRIPRRSCATSRHGPGAAPGPPAARRARGDRRAAVKGSDAWPSRPTAPGSWRATHDATLFVWRIEDGRLLRKIPRAHGNLGERLGDESPPELSWR